MDVHGPGFGLRAFFENWVLKTFGDMQDGREIADGFGGPVGVSAPRGDYMAKAPKGKLHMSMNKVSSRSTGKYRILV